MIDDRDRGVTAVLEPPGVAAPEDAASAAEVGPARAGAGPLALARAALVRDSLRVPLAIFLLSRAYVFLLGAIAMWIDRPLPPVPALGDYYLPELDGLARYFLQPWRNWDGHWYALLAQQGYRYHESVTAFYPLYPLLLRGTSWLLDGQIELAGVLLSNLALLGALVVLYRLVRADFSALTARRTLLYLALFPTSFYLSAVYTEALFLFLAAGCFYAARRDRWWLAGLCGFLAALTRTHGMLLLIPLGIMFVRQQGWRPRRWRANPVSLLLIPMGLLSYMAYLRQVWGDPLMMVRVQKMWERYTSQPFATLRAGVTDVDGCAVRDWNAGVDFCWADRLREQPTLATIRDFNWRWGLSESDFVELVATLFLLALTALAFRYLPLAYSGYLAAGFILPLWSPSSVHPLMSMHRFTLILFPAFIVLALLSQARPTQWLLGLVARARRRPPPAFPDLPVLHGAIVVLSALLLAFFTIQFASWFWVA